MKTSVYDRGITYNATTLKANGIAYQIMSIIKVRTSKVYNSVREIELNALWDTGATRSCISKKYAEELGLKPTDIQKSFGVNGEHNVNVYDVEVDLNQYVRGIQLSVGEAKLHKDDGGPQQSEIGFLIGMDIISSGDFFTGQFVDEDGKRKSMFSFRFPSALEPTDYLKEIRDYNRSVEIKRKKEFNKNNFKNFMNKKK